MAIAFKSSAPAKSDDGLVWDKLDPASLPADILAAFQAFKVASDKAKHAREAFEALMNDKVEMDGDKCLVFSYRYGLSVAIAPKARPSKARPAMSLADLVAKVG